MATKETSDKINLHTVPMVVRFARDGGRDADQKGKNSGKCMTAPT